MDGKPDSRDAEGVFLPFSSEDVPWTEFSHGERFACRWRDLGRFGGGSHVGVMIEELPPGKRSNILHWHTMEEEHVLVLEGTVTVLLGEASYDLGPGGYVCFPAGRPVGHALVNRTGAPCRYVLIGEDEPNDVRVYPEQGRVGVRALGEGYRRSAAMDYWEGEEA